MCLTIDSTVKPPVSGRNYFVGYKLVKINQGNKVLSYFESFQYKDGINNPVGTIMLHQSRIYEGAFHVYLNKKDAEKELLYRKHGFTVNKTKVLKLIPVRCFYKDVIAYGVNHDGSDGVAMKKMTIDKRTMEKAVRQTAK